MTASLSVTKFCSQSSLTPFAFPYSTVSRGCEFVCLYSAQSCLFCLSLKAKPSLKAWLQLHAFWVNSKAPCCLSLVPPHTSSAWDRVSDGRRQEPLRCVDLLHLSLQARTPPNCWAKKEPCFSCIWQHWKNMRTLKYLKW